MADPAAFVEVQRATVEICERGDAASRTIQCHVGDAMVCDAACGLDGVLRSGGGGR